MLKLIIGQLAPTEGTVKIGQLTKFNYVDQSRLQLNDERTVLDEAADGTEFVQWGESKISLRSYLKRFLFADERITTQVKYLSGGERSRLLLARILKCGGNFLILDEPTNDLDLPTLRVLEEALLAFPGVVCVVSHDRYFLNRVCTDILAFEGDGTIQHSVGDYDYYLEKKRRRSRPPPRAGSNPKCNGASRSTAAPRNRPSLANFPSRKRGNWKGSSRRFWRWRRKSRGLKVCLPRRIFIAPTRPKPTTAGGTGRRQGKAAPALRPLGGIGSAQVRRSKVSQE